MLFNIFLCAIGFYILSYAADKLVEGASNLALNFGVSKLAIGMTIVAAGTSLPEMVVSVNASLKGNPELSLGNVVGSNIMNAAFILGIAALIQPIACQKQTIRREVPIMIGGALLLWYTSYTDNIITPKEGLIFVAMFFAYIYLSYHWTKQEGELPETLDEEIEETAENEETKHSTVRNLLFITGGLIGLVVGSESLVRGATFIARSIGVSDEVIGLTLIAIGTSLPELATSIVAARKGHSEITLGNVVGSNIFNIFGIVGCASVVCSFNGIPGSEVLNVSNNMLGIHIPLMVVVSLSVLPIMSTGLKIVRAEGALLIAFYLVYNVILFQSSPQMQAPLNQTRSNQDILLPSPTQPASATHNLHHTEKIDMPLSNNASESIANIPKDQSAKDFKINNATQSLEP
ncbi:MAG: calcium/sodium antiporter [Candidatus Rifleibacteriota bacterium]